MGLGTKDGNYQISSAPDVNLNNPANGDALTYHAGTSKWENAPTAETLMASFGATLFVSVSGLRDTRVVPIIIAGASVAAQIGSDRWVYKFNARLQAAYPRTATGEQAIRTLSTAVSTPPTGTGTFVINAAVSGSNTGTFLTSTTRTQVMNLNPAAVIIADMPANDYGALNTPATVKANMITQLTDLIAKTDPLFPCQFIVIGGYYPTIASPAAPINEYREAMREACAQFPQTTVLWIDTYDYWTKVGVGSGGADPFDLLLADNLHPNPTGHTVLADAVARMFSL